MPARRCSCDLVASTSLPMLVCFIVSVMQTVSGEGAGGFWKAELLLGLAQAATQTHTVLQALRLMLRGRKLCWSFLHTAQAKLKQSWDCGGGSQEGRKIACFFSVALTPARPEATGSSFPSAFLCYLL